MIDTTFLKTALTISLISALAACGGGEDAGSPAPMSLSTAAASSNAAPPEVAPATPPASPPSAVTAKQCTVDVYGDSIMAGNGTSQTPVMVLHAKRPRLKLTDHSVAGTQLMGLANTFMNDTRTGHWVVIENGVIDAWQGKNLVGVEQTLRGMVDFVRSEGREPIFTGFSHQVPTPKSGVGVDELQRRVVYNKLVESIATEMHVPFANWSAVPFNGAGDLQDGIHPARAYSDRLIDQLAATFDAASGCQ